MVSDKACRGSNNPVEGATGCVEAGGAVSVLLEMRGIVRGAAAPAVPGESVKAAIARAARRLRLEYGRARSHWYGLARMVPAEEADRLRARERELMAERLAQIDAERAVLRAMLRARGWGEGGGGEERGGDGVAMGGAPGGAKGGGDE